MNPLFLLLIFLLSGSPVPFAAAHSDAPPEETEIVEPVEISPPVISSPPFPAYQSKGTIQEDSAYSKSLEILDSPLPEAPDFPASEKEENAPKSDRSQSLMQLQILWGEGIPVRWKGRIELSEGEIGNPMLPLGKGADVSGAYFLEQGVLHIRDHRARDFCGVQFYVYAPITASVRIHLEGNTLEQPYEKTVELRDLWDQSFQSVMDRHENRLFLARTPEDSLLIVPKSDSLLFEPGESLDFEVFPRLFRDLHDSNMQHTLEFSLHRTKSGEKIPGTDRKIPLDRNELQQGIPLSLNVPPEEGVYEISLSVREKEQSQSFPGSDSVGSEKESPLATRRFQFLVLDPRLSVSRKNVDPQYTHETVLSIDPSEVSWWRSVGENHAGFQEFLHKSSSVDSSPVENPVFRNQSQDMWEKIKTLPSKVVPLRGNESREPLQKIADIPSGHGKTHSHDFTLSPPPVHQHREPRELSERLIRSRWNHGKISVLETRLGPFMVLHASGSANSPSWSLFPIPVEHPGQPHLLEVEYLSSHPQSFGISVLENEKGTSIPHSLQSGVDVGNEIAKDSTPPGISVHRILFWPRSELPVVLISNQQVHRDALFGRIRVHRITSDIPRRFSDPPRRLFLGSLSDPFSRGKNFPEKAVVERKVGDWSFYHEEIGNLVDYLQWVGYGGAMICVAGEEYPLYPVYAENDSGILPDPVKKDVVELIARHFDRESLVFIPGIDFNASLPRLNERIRREKNDWIRNVKAENTMSISENRPESESEFAGMSGYFWTDPKGNRIEEIRNVKSGKAPHYNLLHPVVQEEMLLFVQEILTRYGNHPSFGGIAIQLSPEGFAQLPEEFWGMDDRTILMFQEETNIALPKGTGPERFLLRYNHIRKHCMDRWVQWRAEKVGDFYRKMGRMIAEHRSDAKLYLTGARMLEGARIQNAFYPTFSEKHTLFQMLLILGFDLSELGKEESIVFLRPEKTVLSGHFGQLATQWEMEQSDSYSVFHQFTNHPGAFFHYHTESSRIPSFERKNPFHWESVSFEFPAVPSEEQNRKRFLRQLAKADYQVLFEGGTFLAQGQEESLRDFIATFRQLPSVPFRNFDRNPKPLNTPSSGHFEENRAASPEPPSDSFDPLVVRYANTEQGTFVYLLNGAPYHLSSRITLSAKPGTQMKELPTSRTISPAHVVENRMLWDVSLKPYDLVAMQLNDPHASPLRVDVQRPGEICGHKGKYARGIDAIIRAIHTPVAWKGLENSEFENTTANSRNIPGWKKIGDETFSVSLDEKNKHWGRTSLKMSSPGMSGGILSNSFDPPQTGRLFISLWVGYPKEKGRIPLRLALTGTYRDSGEVFLRTASLENLDHPDIHSSEEVSWREIKVPFTSLPLTGLDQLRIRLDLSGEGTVWIDDIRMEHIAFKESERVQLMKTISVAGFRWSEGRYSELQTLLEGFWPRVLLEQHHFEKIKDETILSIRVPRTEPDSGILSVPRPPITSSTTEESRNSTLKKREESAESESFLEKLWKRSP